MNSFENERKKKAYEILTSVKIISNTFAAMAVLGNINKYVNNLINPKYIIVILTFSVVTIFQAYIYISNDNNDTQLKIKSFIEISMLLICYFFIVKFTGGYKSQYKILFIFSILITTVQFCVRMGNILALTIASIILITDIINKPSSISNEYFCNDIVLVGVFLLTNILLGFYIKIYSEDEIRYQRIMELLPNGIFIYSKDEILFTNEFADSLIQKADMGRLLQNKINDEGDLENFHLSGIGSNHKEEINIELKDETISFEVMSTLYPYNGNNVVMSVVHDITERKKAESLSKEMEVKGQLIEQMKEYDRLKTEFFSNMSHEFRTPINIILGTLQLINTRNLEDLISKDMAWLRKNHEAINHNCLRLLKLVNNLLDITKIDANYLSLNIHNHDIVTAIEDITMSVVNYTHNRGLSLCFDTEIEEKVMAFDIDKIERVMLNLLSNAIKFTRPGGSIFVNLYDMVDNICISVKDTGIGIPQDKLSVIFERFRQVDGLLMRNAEGSGIGLSLVKSLIELHGGKVKVKSEIGKGTEFIVSLPVKTIDEECDIEKINSEINQYNNTEKVKIEFSDI